MPRVFSGIQPSGELHIGNYLGAVKNWVELQHRYECLFCIVDYHAITVPYEPGDLRRRTMDMALSLLAAGLDPEKCTVFAALTPARPRCATSTISTRRSTRLRPSSMSR